MQIKVLFFGALREIIGCPEECVTLQQETNIGRLYELYTERFPCLRPHSASLLFSRNREFVGRDELLREGDEIAFLPPVSGGAGADADSDGRQDRCTVYRLTRDVIDTRALVQEMTHRSNGAIVVFEGIVRDHSGEKKTLFLEYEAYETMALAKMLEITDQVRSRFGIDSIGMIHRLGHLEIGEASVVIVVTSEHRGPAFEACRYAIDHLKRTVPIWKKEFFEGGAVWVEGDSISGGMAEPHTVPH